MTESEPQAPAERIVALAVKWYETSNGKAEAAHELALAVLDYKRAGGTAQAPAPAAVAGSIAVMALRGKPVQWIDSDGDSTPSRIVGEVLPAAATKPFDLVNEYQDAMEADEHASQAPAATFNAETIMQIAAVNPGALPERMQLAPAYYPDSIAFARTIERAHGIEKQGGEWDDGDRFRWLTEDHADPEERAARDRIIASLPGRSASGARIDIDANAAEFTRNAMRRTGCTS